MKSIVYMAYQVVVARYQENIEWLQEYDKEKVLVYNKDNRACVCPYQVIDLPNVGREAHTYLTYIVTHYDCLPEIIFFTQGRMCDHMHCIGTDFLGIEDYSRNYVEDSFFTGLTPEGRITHYYGAPITPASMTGPEWFRKYIDTEADLESLKIWYGAIFSVHRKYIRSQPLEKYKILLQELQKDKCPEEAHFMERSWFYLFQCHRELESLRKELL